MLASLFIGAGVRTKPTKSWVFTAEANGWLWSFVPIKSIPTIFSAGNKRNHLAEIFGLKTLSVSLLNR